MNIILEQQLQPQSAMTQMKKARIVVDQAGRRSWIIRGHPRFNLRSSASQGQVTLEYLIIFAVSAVVMIVGYKGWYRDKIWNAVQEFLNLGASVMAGDRPPPPPAVGPVAGEPGAPG